MPQHVAETLQQLEKAFGANEAMHYWLDTGTGKLEVVLDDMAGEPEMIALVERFAADPDRYTRLPHVDPREEYRLMTDFAGALPDSNDKTALRAALTARNGAHRFTTTLNGLPRLRRQWDARRKDWLDHRIRNWLKAHDLELAAESE